MPFYAWCTAFDRYILMDLWKRSKGLSVDQPAWVKRSTVNSTIESKTTPHDGSIAGTTNPPHARALCPTTVCSFQHTCTQNSPGKRGHLRQKASQVLRYRPQRQFRRQEDGGEVRRGWGVICTVRWIVIDQLLLLLLVLLFSCYSTVSVWSKTFLTLFIRSSKPALFELT